MVSAWSEISGSLEIKEIMPVPLIVVCGNVILHQQCDAAKWGHPGICAYAEVYSIMDNKSGEMCFYYFLNVTVCCMWKTSHGKIYIWIHLWITHG